MIHAFGSFFFDAELKTLENLNDSTLSKSIASPALRVSPFLSFSLFLLCFVLLSGLSYYLFPLLVFEGHYYRDRERANR